MADATGVLMAAAVQLAATEDVDANRAAAAAWIDGAADRGAALIVLPEYAQHCSPTLAATAPGAAEPLDGPFVSMLAERAAAHDALVVAGLVERTDAGPSNTVVAVDASGLRVAYRKVHLYDAFGSSESDWLTPGDAAQVPVVDFRGTRIGIETCYDLRFPETTRRLVDAGADVILVPAEWVRGPQKERHWTTLVTARAIESTVHVVAAGQAPPLGVGCSLIADPMGIPLAALGDAEGIAIAPLDPAVTAATRRRNPSLANRRYRIA
ncbi:carbon-nitrogen hydrolase family protein [Agrococcus sp. Marseille-Q4369]|uniref:carbon-nitrogen hydrolase family protein n=1 Tax=Agrococcus sp. Marseille-Q4369 TaxID=2810513 RepID=UPI001B8C9321|nr:carbon-nitrogen hydrolase family protein [Agrococcus sp. Marseille-Q4369]QUW18827.1 carbon-nitrogen hydrolase family protein [Agrococcus sp. Marseille-Q4369]